MARQYEDDDGRVICPMDVDGMRGGVFRPRGAARLTERAELRKKVDAGEPLTRSEYRRYSFYAVLGGLCVVGVIGGAVVLFIFLLTLLWR